MFCYYLIKFSLTKKFFDLKFVWYFRVLTNDFIFLIMDEISIKKCFEEEINRILFDEKFQEIDVIKRGFIIQDKQINNSILFIGINPSFDGKSNNIETKFYDLNQFDCKSNHKYFSKFQDISTKVNESWSHIDLLYFRETNQNFIKKLLNDEVGIEFIDRQLEISIKMIEKINPKIIVVNNTMARNLLGFNNKSDKSRKDLEFTFDNNLGTYRIVNHPNLNDTPIFFTSMLTGQRALDLGSYERLVWHIGFVLDELNKD